LKAKRIVDEKVLKNRANQPNVTTEQVLSNESPTEDERWSVINTYFVVISLPFYIPLSLIMYWIKYYYNSKRAESLPPQTENEKNE
jgi:hypothetical protein